MTMNYINSIGRLLAVSVAVWMASCHGDLDIMQDNKLSVSNMWKTSVQVESSTYGIYAAMRENFNQDQINVLFWGELRMGGYMWGPSHVAQVWVGRDVIENIMTSSTASANWSKLYSAIDQANAVLKYAPLVPMTDAQRSWAVGQAALRTCVLLLLGGAPVGRRTAQSEPHRVGFAAGDLPLPCAEGRGLRPDRSRYPDCARQRRESRER